MAVEISNVLIPLSLSLIIILIFIHKQFKGRAFARSLTLPPGPRPWPILGNIMQLRKMPHVTLWELSKTYGPLMSLKLGTQIVVVGSSASVAKEIFKEKDRLLSARYVPHVVQVERSELSNASLGWSPECGDGWKYLRTICRTELFSWKALESQSHQRENNIMEMVELVSSKEGSAINVRELLFATTFNMLSNILVSKDTIVFKCGTVDGKLMDVVREMSKVVATLNVSDLYPLLGRLDLQGLRRKYVNSLMRVNDTWKAVVEDRRNAKQNGNDRATLPDFLDILIDNGITDEGIDQIFMELLTAGTDTSSSTIEWAMAELIKKPESMIRVREELAREIGQGVPKECDLPKLLFLHACIKEILRLRPPAPLLLPHRAPETCNLMGYTIPIGSQILVNVWAMGRDPMIWENPLQFEPERFVSSSLDFKGNDFEYIPFGAGRRICPGLPMATKHVALILASLVNLFDWTLPNGMDPSELDMCEKSSVTLQKAQPLVLIPKVRK